MDIMTSVGLVSGIIVVTTMVLMGGDLHMFVSEHAVIIIFGGSIAATMIRFPLMAIMHGLPLGAKFAFTMSRLSARDLVDEYVLSYAEGVMKPDPKIFLTACQRVGVAPERTLMIGDSVEADGGATAVGCAFVTVARVPPGDRPSALTEALAAHGVRTTGYEQ